MLSFLCRKIRHRNVINLMAIAFEPHQRLALIMEPTKYSLNHYVFVKVGLTFTASQNSCLKEGMFLIRSK